MDQKGRLNTDPPAARRSPGDSLCNKRGQLHASVRHHDKIGAGGVRKEKAQDAVAALFGLMSERVRMFEIQARYFADTDRTCNTPVPPLN
jgi:hypothetical protein